MHHLNIDLETYSSVPINKAGAFAYALSADFEILLFAYSLDGGDVSVLDLAQGDRIPEDLCRLLFDPACIKHAYNAAFEWWCLSRYYGLDETSATAWLPQWRCTMMHALYCGYPAGLAGTGAALGLPTDKRKLATGGALIRTFCVPVKPTKANGMRTRTLPRHEPEKWALFITYNRQDVVTEQEIERRLSPFPVPDDVQRQWETDQRVNAHGVAVDRELVRSALSCAATTSETLTQEAVALSGLDNPNSVRQLTCFLAEELDDEVSTLRKADVTALLGRDALPDTVRRLLEIRQELGKTSCKKYDTLAAATCADGRIRGVLLFYGANRTGRWAGRLVQVQNLPRTHLDALALCRDLIVHEDLPMLRLTFGNVPDTLSQMIRTAFVAAPGNWLFDADFSAIEARVVAWVAGEEWVLDVFRSHGKIYEATASQLYGVPIETITKGQENYALRQFGKAATLALGYQGGAPALIRAGHLSEDTPPEQLEDIKRRWRTKNRRIVDLWYALERAAHDTVRTGRANDVRCLHLAMEGDPGTNQCFLTITLPSGRRLFYVRPELRPGERGEVLHYQGVDQQSKKFKDLETYGGKLTENCVQAIARDCLAESLERLEAAGFPVVFHVHDEAVVDMPSDDPESTLAAMCDLMGQAPDWAPDLPLRAEGWYDRHYKKD